MNKLAVLTVRKESPRSNTTSCSDSGATSLRYILISSPFTHYGNRVLFSLNCGKVSLSSSVMYVQYNQLSLIQPLKDKMNQHYVLQEDSIPASKEHSVLPEDQSVHAMYGNSHSFCGKNAEFLTLNPTVHILTNKPWSANRTDNIIWRIRIMLLLREQFLPTYCYINTLRVSTRSVRKVSSHFEYLENWSRDLDRATIRLHFSGHVLIFKA